MTYHRISLTKRGFTLVETMVAITILSIGIAGAMTLVVTSTKNNSIAQQTTSAVYLVNEGIEAIRALRDNNAIAIQCNTFPVLVSNGYCPSIPGATDKWDIAGTLPTLSQCNDPGVGGHPCYLDVTQSPVIFYQCASSACAPAVVKDSSTHLFRQSSSPIAGATDTPFSRVFWATSVNGHEEDIVTVEVSWTDSYGDPHRVDITESIQNVADGNI